MQKFIGMIDYGDDELQQMNQFAEHREMGREMVEDHGGEVIDVYYTLGEPDVIVIAEFPDAEAMTQATYRIFQDIEGDVEVVPGYTGEEFDDLVEEYDDTPE